jgi:ketosteroid isomerase-like protein
VTRSPDPASILAEINHVWLKAPADAIVDLLLPHFTDDAVFVAPNLERVARGSATVAASYAQFARNERGHDTYVFRQDGDRWRICWRSMVCVPAES